MVKAPDTNWTKHVVLFSSMGWPHQETPAALRSSLYRTVCVQSRNYDTRLTYQCCSLLFMLFREFIIIWWHPWLEQVTLTVWAKLVTKRAKCLLWIWVCSDHYSKCGLMCVISVLLLVDRWCLCRCFTSCREASRYFEASKLSRPWTMAANVLRHPTPLSALTMRSP